MGFCSNLLLIPRKRDEAIFFANGSDDRAQDTGAHEDGTQSTPDLFVDNIFSVALDTFSHEVDRGEDVLFVWSFVFTNPGRTIINRIPVDRKLRRKLCATSSNSLLLAL
jgi:hypothetical protein